MESIKVRSTKQRRKRKRNLKRKEELSARQNRTKQNQSKKHNRRTNKLIRGIGQKLFVSGALGNPNYKTNPARKLLILMTLVAKKKFK